MNIRTSILVSATPLSAAGSSPVEPQSEIKPTPITIDGNRNAGIEIESRCIVKGDARCASIAAASILAKVTRDRYMYEMAEKYPGYGFEAHKGYGTKAHYAAVRELGPSEIHRMSFLKKLH